MIGGFASAARLSLKAMRLYDQLRATGVTEAVATGPLGVEGPLDNE